MVFSVGVTGASAALNFAMQLIVMRLFGVAGYGAFAYWRNNVWLAGSIGRFGFQGLAFRELALMQVQGSREHLRSFTRLAVLVVLVLGSAAAGALLVADVASLEPKGEGWLFWVSSLLFAASLTANSAYRVLGSLRLSLVYDRVVQNALFIPLVLLAWIEGLTSVEALYALLALSVAIPAALNLAGAWRGGARTRFPEEAVMPPPDWGKWLRSGWHLFLLAMASIVAQRGTLLIAGWYLSPADLGRFAFMAMVAALISLPLTALNQVTAPALARHRAAEEWQDIRAKIRFTRLAATLVGLAFSAVLLLAYPVVERLVGQPGLIDLPVFAVLLVATILNASFGPVAIGLSMLGEERYAAAVLNMAVVLKIAALLVAGSIGGLMGFAVIEVAFMLFWNGLMAWKLGRVLKARLA